MKKYGIYMAINGVKYKTFEFYNKANSVDIVYKSPKYKFPYLNLYKINE